MPSDNKAAERFSGTMLNRAFLQNPVLVGALGLCPIVGGAVSLKAGLVLSAAFTAGMMLNMLAAHFVLKKLPRWLRMPAYVLVALAAVCPAGYVLETRAETLLSSVGIYLALLAVSSLISVRGEKTFVVCGLKRSFMIAAAECAGYAAVIMAVSFVRELAGSGTLWDVTLTKRYFAPGLLLPFGGFQALGFLAALHRGYVARHFALRGALKDITFDLSAAAGPLITPAADIPERRQPVPAPAAEEQAETSGTQPAEVSAQEPGEGPAEEPREEENRPETTEAIPVETPQPDQTPAGNGPGFTAKAWEPPAETETETDAQPSAETDADTGIPEGIDTAEPPAAREDAAPEETDAPTPAPQAENEQGGAGS